MSDFGNYTLCLAWGLCLLSSIGGFFVFTKFKKIAIQFLPRLTISVGFLTAVSVISLGTSFLQNDYSNQYVWQFSNRSMYWVYKISAIWGGMDGSMLLWAAILGVGIALFAARSEHVEEKFRTLSLGLANLSTLFFLTVTTFATNPFRAIGAPFIPPDGNGLNPLLQNPLMAIHPPTLYMGFTLHALPAAIALAGIMLGDRGGKWIQVARPWSLIAWSFLTAGIVLGGHWAYVELGWGGFWAWDPVENASFLPWLLSTAFVHSAIVQERKGMLKLWNVWLVVGAYALTVYGTFLTRSGVVQSVHAFAETDIGWIFLLYLGLYLAFVIGVCVKQFSILQPERSIQSILSREAFILFNNLIFTAICFAIFWGVMFPVFSEALTGQKQAVGIPFFNKITIPLFLTMLALLLLGPVIAWGKDKAGRVVQFYKIPFVFGAICVAILLWAGITSFYPVVTYALCMMIATAIMMELHNAARIQKLALGDSAASNIPGSGLVKLSRRHPTKVGSHIVHLGVVIVTIGITASMAHKIEHEFHLTMGATHTIGSYEVTLQDLEEVDDPSYESVKATLAVKRIGETETKLIYPEIRTYKKNKETTTEVALNVTLRDDLYVVLFEVNDGISGFKMFVNPLQVWLWIGTIVMLIGSVFVIVPRIRWSEARNALPGTASVDLNQTIKTKTIVSDV